MRIRLLGLAVPAVVTLVCASSAHAEDPCQIGLKAAAAGDNATAFAALETCLEGEPGAKVRVAAKKARRAVLKRIRVGRYGEVSLVVEPPEATVEVAAIPFAVSAQRTIYLPVGRHVIRAELEGHRDTETTLELASNEYRTVVLTLERVASEQPAPPETARVDFENEPPPALPASRPQEAEEFPSLIPEKMQRGRPRGDVESESSGAPRWPWAIALTGVAVAAAGGVAHASGRDGLALGLYLGGASLIGGGGVALALTRPRRAPPADPPLKLGAKGKIVFGYLARF